MKKAIVTGATGFIGKKLVRELLEQNVDVIAIIRPNSRNKGNLPKEVRVIECGLGEFYSLPLKIADRDIDAIFSVAWQGVSDSDARDPKVQIQNIVSTLDLIDATHEMGIKTFVGCGSIHEYEAIVEMEHDNIVSNLGMYYKSAKTTAHWMGKAKAGSYGIRFFWPYINTYGEEENSARLINTVIRKIFKGESPALSSGNQYYDFVHVCDVAHALYLIAEKGIDGTNYTIGSGEARPLKDYLVIVGRIANEINGSCVSLGFGKITSGVVNLPKKVFDIDKLQQDTGFIPRISFEDGIRRTASWIKDCELKNN